SGIHGVAANEFFFAGILQILPAGHPHDGVVSNTVGEARLTEELWQIARSRFAVQVIAQITAQLAAGIGNACGPMTRLRVEPNARGFHVRSRDDDGTAKNFHLLPGLAIDVCDPVGNSVFIHKNIFRQSVGAEFEIPGSFGERQETPRRGEKGAGVTSGRTRTAKVTCGMAGVIHGELRDAVMKIRDTIFSAPFCKMWSRQRKLNGGKYSPS